MKVLIVGHFSENSKSNIVTYFPSAWEVVVAPPGEEALRHLEDCQVLIPEHIRVDHDLLAGAKQLKLVQTGAGYDNVDIPACTELGIWAANAAGVNARAVAEHVMAQILSFYKNIPFLDDFMKNGGDENQLEYAGSELSGRTIGIIGLGAIGKQVAKFCDAFDMNVLAYARNPSARSGGPAELTDFDTLIRTSDIVSVHVPLTRQTERLMNKESFRKMKSSALLVNTSRGAIVHEADLIDALKSGGIAGACLDVFESEPLPLHSELRNLDNVILTPHTAGMPDGRKFHKKRYDFFIENIKRAEKGEEPVNKLNRL